MLFEPHSTRLFPKHRGSDAYRLTGLAAHCDWVVLSDTKTPTARLVCRTGNKNPRHIFLSLRSPFDGLNFFVREVLPLLREPFVLISGSEDITIPRQTDARWRKFNDCEQHNLREILNSPLLVRWFAENLDDSSDPRFAPLPLGLVFKEGTPRALTVPRVPRLEDRPLRALCAHRVREGEQWETRRHVTAMAKAHWQDWCTVLDEEVSEDEFVELVEAHAFVLCVPGGGLDPSPKAWKSLLHGAIPIITDSALNGAYQPLPVAFIPQWAPSSITAQKLADWRDELGPEFQGEDARRKLVHKLSLDYWWAQIEAASR